MILIYFEIDKDFVIDTSMSRRILFDFDSLPRGIMICYPPNGIIDQPS